MPGAAMAARQASMVIDANSGAVLHAEDADAPRYPASLTKMMTLYVVFELIERGVLSFSTPIRMSESAAGRPPSKLGLDAGESIRLDDAVKALITKSANDVAAAVAEHVAGSEAKFARRMTATAQRIGMASTTFKNASGLTENGQVTTARDMLTLALRLHDDFPQHYRLFATRSFQHNGRSYSNHNGLLRSFQGTDGIKTGYTRASGFNIVSSVRRGRRHLVGVVFGGASARQRDAKMRVVLTRTLAKASPERTRRGPTAPLLVARPALAPRPKQVATAAADAWSVKITPPTPRLVQAAPPRSVVQQSRHQPSNFPAPAVTGGLPSVAIAAVRPVRLTPRTPMHPARPGSIGELIGRHVDRSATLPQTAAAAASAGPGRTPSTLSAQAAELAGARFAGWPTPGSAPATAPVHRVRGTTDTTHQIQVGAYRSQTEAERQIASVRERAGGLLAQFAPVTMAIAAGSSQLFRARFAGFDAANAATTCAELRRRGIDCLVARGQ